MLFNHKWCKNCALSAEKKKGVSQRRWFADCGWESEALRILPSRTIAEADAAVKTLLYGFPNVVNSNLLTFTMLLVCRLINVARRRTHFHRPTKSRNIFAVNVSEEYGKITVLFQQLATMSRFFQNIQNESEAVLPLTLELQKTLKWNSRFLQKSS